MGAACCARFLTHANSGRRVHRRDGSTGGSVVFVHRQSVELNSTLYQKAEVAHESPHEIQKTFPIPASWLHLAEIKAD